MARAWGSFRSTLSGNGVREVRTAADQLLERMKALGVDYIFGNAGTDFPPIIEALARPSGPARPEPVLVAHETVAVGMAHGYFLATGRAQCAMVHVNVGVANSVMGLINAASDRVPILMVSGRTPVTERGRHGSRSSAIHWGQETRDQGSMVRDVVKWDYELRYPEQAAMVVDRALAIAHSDPMGPVYLSLPREALAEACADEPALDPRQQPAKLGVAPPDAIAAAADLIRNAKRPLIIAQRLSHAGEGLAIAAMAERFAIAVSAFWSSRNVVGTDHPMFVGGDPRDSLNDADLVISIEAVLPWPTNDGSRRRGRTIAIGVDPLFPDLPMRNFATDVTLAGDPALTLAALAEALEPIGERFAETIEQRRAAIGNGNRKRRASVASRVKRHSARSTTRLWVSHCLSVAKDASAVVFSELGCDVSAMHFNGPSTYLHPPLSSGLGWGLPAALGFQLANRDRQVIACVGDGAYIFANPVACHLVAMAQRLPVLTVIFNNAGWQAVRGATERMYPGGHASRSEVMPFTALSPVPDYAAIARAHGLWAERVEGSDAVPGAIDRALSTIRDQRLPALLDVIIGSD